MKSFCPKKYQKVLKLMDNFNFFFSLTVIDLQMGFEQGFAHVRTKNNWRLLEQINRLIQNKNQYIAPKGSCPLFLQLIEPERTLNITPLAKRVRTHFSRLLASLWGFISLVFSPFVNLLSKSPNYRLIMPEKILFRRSNPRKQINRII